MAEAKNNSTPPPQTPRSATRTEQSLRQGISPKYINSKVRKLDLKTGKPLPLRVMQLRRRKCDKKIFTKTSSCEASKHAYRGETISV